MYFMLYPYLPEKGGGAGAHRRPDVLLSSPLRSSEPSRTLISVECVNGVTPGGRGARPLLSLPLSRDEPARRVRREECASFVLQICPPAGGEGGGVGPGCDAQVLYAMRP